MDDGKTKNIGVVSMWGGSATDGHALFATERQISSKNSISSVLFHPGPGADYRIISFNVMSLGFAGDAGLAISDPDLEIFFLNNIEFSMNYITSIYMDIYRILNH